MSRSDGRERRNKEQSTGAPRSLLPPPSPPGGLRPRDPLARPAFPQNRGARTPELLSTSPPGAGTPHQGQRPAQAQTPLLFLLLEPSHDGPSPGQAPARKATAGKRRPGHQDRGLVPGEEAVGPATPPAPAPGVHLVLSLQLTHPPRLPAAHSCKRKCFAIQCQRLLPLLGGLGRIRFQSFACALVTPSADPRGRTLAPSGQGCPPSVPGRCLLWGRSP